ASTNFVHAQYKRDVGVLRLQSDIIAFGHSFSVDDSEARMTERNRAYADHIGAKLDDDLRRRGSRTGSGEALGPGLNKSRKRKSVAFFHCMPPKNYSTDRQNHRPNDRADKYPTRISRHHSGTLQNKWRIGSIRGSRAFLRVHCTDQSLRRKLVWHQLHTARNSIVRAITW